MATARAISQHAARTQRTPDDVVGAQHGEPLLGKHPHNGGEQPVIAGEGGPADTGQDLGSLKIWTQIQQAGPLDRPHQDQVLHQIGPQQGQDAACGADPGKSVRKAGNQGRISKILERQDKDGAPGVARRAGHLGRERTAAGQDAEGAWRPPRLTLGGHEALRSRDGWAEKIIK
jgi:hypothetical protein